MNSIFKEYDIRGIYPTEISEEVAFKVGQATAKYLKANKLVVGRDGRISSPSLMDQVVKGIASTGCDVVLVDEATTPLFYFSVNTTLADGGIMVTASHNPKEYNGFKIVREKSIPIRLDTGLKDIAVLMEQSLEKSSKEGLVDRKEFIDDYVNFLLEETRAGEEDLGKLKIVVDASNGMTGLVLKNLFRKINLTAFPIFFDIDGNFPNHSPDTSQEESLRHLKEKVKSIGAELGVAFDGDGDRIALVDELGQVIRGDYIVGLLYQAMGDPLTVYDMRSSRSIKEMIGEKGVPSRVGAVFHKDLMREHGADLGGELSGHFFFKEMNYAESAVLAMLKILVSLNRANASLSAIVKPLDRYVNSGEVRIETGTKDIHKIFSNLKSKYSDGKLNEMDGILIEYSNWWFNLRSSNTEPVLKLVIEADTKEILEEKQAELFAEINSRD